MSRSFRLRQLPRLRPTLPALSRPARRYTSKASVNNAPALASRQNEYIPPPPLTTPSKSDDDLLKAHFDSPTQLLPSFDGRSGLFLYGPLQRPTDLRPLTDRVLIHTRAIVNRICAARDDPSGRELRLVVKNLDRLSDLLCGVIDMCELIRNLHPDEAWVMESERSYERLCGFMNELNTHVGMYEVLVAAVRHPHPEPLSPAERQVAVTFLNDFEKSGIHLPPDIRARFVEISDNLLTVGRTFLSNIAAGPSTDTPIKIPDPENLLAGMGSRFVNSLPRRFGSALIAPGSWESQMILRYAREGEARRLVYVGGMRADPDRVGVLEEILRQRAELAGVVGKETWGEVVLADKMAKTPANVMKFLSSLATHHRPAAAADIATLQRLKATALTGNQYPSDFGTKHLPPLHAWDRDFYSERYTTTMTPNSSLPSIAPYFSTGTALLGLSKLFSKLYGISLKPASIAPGEAWHSSVRKLDVIHETEGLIGAIYCDLFSREGKPHLAAHYTVRCSRRVDDDDVAGDGLADGWADGLGDGLDTEGVRIKGKEGRYQLPIVVLTTDVGSVHEGQPALLSWNDLETLFHEMGHAIHSMIGRTEYHNVSGTRCATDFVELPSIIMEHFVSSPSVIDLFATHHATGEKLSIPLLQSHLSVQRSLGALETHGQIAMALLDQRYHAITHSQAASLDSSEMYTQLQNEIGVIPPVPGTAWQTQFGHLYGYGATYYSYLFDRAIAGKMWSTLFSGEPDGSISREGGEIFKEKVLKWGGGKDPWAMVGDVIGGAEGEAISKGDEKAMDMVGGWLIK